MGVIELPLNGKFYSDQEFLKIKRKILNEYDKLKGRANRLNIEDSNICFLGIIEEKRKYLLKKAIQLHQKYQLEIEDSVLLLSLHILESSGLVKDDYKSAPKSKLELFLATWMQTRGISASDKNIYDKLDYIHQDDDFLGAFYQSIISVATKSLIGSYFTPSNLLNDISFNSESTVLDPCCGSGGILLRVINKNHNPAKIFARDIDKIALNICIVNLSLFFKSNEIKFDVKYSDILKSNKTFELSLFDKVEDDLLYDNIITNPPWGSKIDFSEKDKLMNNYPEISTSESFSIALYNSINKLNKNGKLIFFLPHSILNVKTHKNIRKYLLSRRKRIVIDLLGNCFQGVVSEAIRLTFFNTKHSDSLEINNNGNKYNIHYKDIKKDDYIIQATANQAEKEIISYVFGKKHITLKNNAEFSIGIVTGNNAMHIKNNNVNGRLKPIFRGKEIVPFKVLSPKCFIDFHPEQYQQIAPIEKYREMKIVYRFISDKLICALDCDGRLLLNSANMFIPKVDYPTYTILCLLNSKLYSFIFRKLFHSKKVLRSHIETLPLPILSRKIHRQFEAIYNKCAEDEHCINALNEFVYITFKLSQEQIETVEKEF